MNKGDIKLYISDQTNPYLNVAFEKSLLDKGEKAIFLWVNAPCVVIGRNQNPYTECDIAYARKKGIRLVRRYSGGGAVYHDLGNLNYSLITDKEEPELIVGVVKETLLRAGIEVVQNGRNDLTVDDKKISGMAFIVQENALLYHGTCMCEVDIGELERVLTPSLLKLKSKGIASVRSRVVNLREKNEELGVEALIGLFKEVIGIEPAAFVIDDEIRKEAEKLTSKEWIFGESPRFNTDMEIKTAGGLYQLYIEVKDGRIAGVKVYTDAMKDLPCEEEIRAALVGMDYEPEKVEVEIKKKFCENCIIKY